MGGWAHPVASLTGSVSSSTCWGERAAVATADSMLRCNSSGKQHTEERSARTPHASCRHLWPAALLSS